MTAKERLVEIIKYYKEARTDEGLADAILKEFVRRDDCIGVVEEWINEDELTEETMYDTLFPLSKVDFVRMFPKKILRVAKGE